jgi:MFS family permease
MAVREDLSRRNFLAIAGDFVFFGIGLTFASQTTVLPSFVARLTSSDMLIGLTSTIATGAWLLPQLFTANLIAGKPRKKLSVAVPGAISRSLFLLLCPVALLASRHPSTALLLFFVLYFVAYVLDGIASTAWFDIMGKSLAPAARSRLTGVGQVGAGIGGVAGGVTVGYLLSSSRFPFPTNYALLFAISGAFLGASIVSFLFLREQPEHTGERPLPWREYMRGLPRVLSGDSVFRRVTGAWLLMGAFGLALPFYIIYGLEGLGFAPLSIGVFTAAQVAGSIVSALVMASVGERRGTRAVMRMWGVCAAAAPLLALGIGLARPLPVSWLMYGYSGVFFLAGWQGNALMAGFINYVLEIAPVSRRPLYIGLANTLSAGALAMPLLGGWLLSATGSYAALFGLAAAGSLAGLVLALRLPEPRGRGKPAES